MFTTAQTKITSALVASTIAAAAVAPAAGARDLRLIDERESRQTPVGQQDLRSPDTRDAAQDYGPTLAPEPVAGSSGFDWVSAAIGAAAGTGLMILAVALASTGRRRHRVLRA